MEKYLVKNIKGFTNKNKYSFDFTIGDLKNYNDDISIFDSVNDVEKLVLFFNNKSYVLPKKITLEWIDKKLNTNTNYRNFTLNFKKLVKFGNIYPTSYGIGYSCLFSNKEKMDEDLGLITKELNDKKIKFSTEYSDAMYVLRFIISTKKENIEKINSL